MRKRSYTDEQLAEAIGGSFSWGTVIRKLGLRVGGGTYNHIQKTASRLGLDSSHFKDIAWNKDQRFPQRVAKRLEAYLVLNGPYISTVALKNKLWSANLKPKQCEECGITVWRGQQAPLEIHHKNQNSKDNRIENLAILCANCHALKRVDNIRAGDEIRQTCGAQNAVPSGVRVRIPPSLKICPGCGAGIGRKSVRCLKCAHLSQHKVEHPTKEELSRLVWEKPTRHLAEDFGVSDKAIEKWCKAYGIQKPPRGYWT